MSRMAFLLLAPTLVAASEGQAGYLARDPAEDAVQDLVPPGCACPRNENFPEPPDGACWEDYFDVAPFEHLGLAKACVVHDGIERCFYTYDGSRGGTKVPLVIDLHGFVSCGLVSALYTGWREKAAEEGFVAVWPNGRNASWNGGDCCGFAQAQGVDDVGFVNAVVQQTLATHAAVDPQRVYAGGHSNGCIMAQRLAAEESSPFAAVGCHSGQLLLSDSQLPRPFTPAAAVMVVQGKEDTVVPFEATPPRWPGALPNINRWAALSECGSRAVDDTHAAPSDPSYIKYAFAGCAQGDTAVVLLEVRGLSDTGHNPFARAQVSPKSAVIIERDFQQFGPGVYGFQTTVNTTTLVWDFVRQFSRELLSPPPSPAPRSPPVDCPEGCVPKKPMRALLFASTHRCPEGCVPA